MLQKKKKKDEHHRTGCLKRGYIHALDSFKDDEYRYKNQKNSVSKSR